MEGPLQPTPVEQPPAPPPNPPGWSATLVEGDKILAYHGALIYEAKVLKTEQRADPQSTRLGAQKQFFLIHYQGWKDRWDEWVDDTRIMPFTDENLKFQKNLKETFNRLKKRDRPNSKKKPSNLNPKRIIHDGPTPFEVDLPSPLQKKLNEDFDFIHNQKCLIPLPRSPSVADIIQLFTPEANSLGAECEELLAQLRDLFNKTLGTCLLYRFERLQYAELLKAVGPERDRSSIAKLYGIEHLLRLLVTLPEIFRDRSVELEAPAKETFKKLINAFLLWISTHLGTFYKDEPVYKKATQLYIRNYLQEEGQ